MTTIELLANQPTRVTKDMSSFYATQDDCNGIIVFESITDAAHSDGIMVNVSVYEGTRDGVFSILAGCFHKDSNFWQTVNEIFQEELNGRKINFSHCVIQSTFNDTPIFIRDTDLIKIIESYYTNSLANH